MSTHNEMRLLIELDSVCKTMHTKRFVKLAQNERKEIWKIIFKKIHNDWFVCCFSVNSNHQTPKQDFFFDWVADNRPNEKKILTTDTVNTTTEGQFQGRKKY